MYQGSRGFQSAGYIDCSWRFSWSVSGKSFGFQDQEKTSGRHGAGRPHISLSGSLLCRRPMACPISCAITFSATFGKFNGLKLAPLMPTTRLPSGSNGPANDTKSESASRMVRSPGRPRAMTAPARRHRRGRR